jgi:hypothetical protein
VFLFGTRMVQVILTATFPLAVPEPIDIQLVSTPQTGTSKGVSGAFASDCSDGREISLGFFSLAP